MEITVEQAMDKIVATLKSDPSYYEAWRNNLREYFISSYNRNSVRGFEGFVFCPLNSDVFQIGNEAAEQFIKNLIAAK